MLQFRVYNLNVSPTLFLRIDTCFKDSETGKFFPRQNRKRKLFCGQIFFLDPLAEQAEELVKEWAREKDPGKLKIIENAKSLIPKELRQGDSCFTSVAFVGSLDRGAVRHNHPHLDKNDLLGGILSLGNVSSGGGTVYYFEDPNSAVKKIGEPAVYVPFKHGRFQVGHFEQVFHEGEEWEGDRGIISFYLTKKIYENFVHNK